MVQIENKDPAPSAKGDRAEVTKTGKQDTKPARKTEAVRPSKRRQRLQLNDPKPWPEVVDGATLLDAIAAMFQRHLALPKGAAEAMALWVLFAHTFDAWNISPRLVFTSPVPECGKTTGLKLVRPLVPRGLLASNVSPAAVYRGIPKWDPTLLFDEVDTLLDWKDELKNLMNSDHDRDGATILRCVGDNHEPTPFSTWAPLAIAKIGGLYPALRSRSIIIPMRRKRPDEVVEPFRANAMPQLEELARKAARFAKDSLAMLRRAEPEMPHGLTNRARDNWLPLFAIADAAGGHWPGMARTAAVLLTPSDDETSIGEELLADIREVFVRKGIDRLTSETLCQELARLPDRPWNEYQGRDRINPRQIARLLTPFGIAPRGIRIAERTPKGYTIYQFEDAFARYLPPLPSETATPQQPSISAVFSHSPAATLTLHVADQAANKPAEILECCGVADTEGVAA
jgi:putative DNA primase/helicase